MLKRSIIASVITALFLSAAASRAVTIDNTYAIGHVLPNNPAQQLDPNSTTAETARLNAIINWHNTGVFVNPGVDNVPTSYNLNFGSNVTPPYPALDGTSTGQIPGANQVSFNLDVTGWEYLLIKSANTAYYFYVGDLTGLQTFQNNVIFNDNQQARAVSHYRLFGGAGTSVPDGGATAVLLGLGIAGLALARRNRS